MEAGILRVAEAAEYLGLAKGTLDNWRPRGVGPKCVRLGLGKQRSTVGYRKADLDAWLARHEETAAA